ncbi:LOW QUALITY PROTEIN: zinc transporter ZIP1, partial [Cygnus olor]|uniref:LOW QUALITY PROTEIN: zinc transporter ZIP1 n=1 Tax=Cygnus olor TaxID=8869 RepID=UPI001ADE7F48
GRPEPARRREAAPGPRSWPGAPGPRRGSPPPGLGLKLGAVAALLLLPLGCGLGPLCCLRHPAGTADSHSPGLSLLSCFAGGVLVGTCLLDLLPAYLAGIAAALEELRVPLQFPLPEFILAMGFFLVLVLEQAALAQQDRASPPAGEEEDEEEATAARALLAAGTPRAPPSPPSPPSPLRAGLLVLALALHAALEGLALGLQEAGGAALRLCLALLLHKGLVAFSLALQLLRGRLRRAAVAACLLLFALMAPLGVAVGLAVTVSGGGPRQRLCRSVLEGLAAGTFLYVAFLEVLPRELGGPRLRVPKVLALLAGFGLVTAVLFIRI